MNDGILDDLPDSSPSALRGPALECLLAGLPAGVRPRRDGEGIEGILEIGASPTRPACWLRGHCQEVMCRAEGCPFVLAALWRSLTRARQAAGG